MTNEKSIINIIKLLIWKNKCVLLESNRMLAMIIFAPVYFILILIVLRWTVSVHFQPALMHEPLQMEHIWTSVIDKLKERDQILEETMPNFEHNIYMPKLIMGYAPNDTEAVLNIMELAANELQGITIESFDNCTILSETIKHQHYFAGICFDYSSYENHIDIYPEILQYSIIYPSELRLGNDIFIGTDWQTSRFYGLAMRAEHRIRSSHLENNVAYITEGFIPIQNAISVSFLNLISNHTELPEILLQAFPRREYDIDPLLNGATISLSLIIVLGYLFPVLYFIQIRVTERHIIKVVLNNIGLTNFEQFCAWFVIGFVTFFISSLIVTTLMKIHWNNGYAICTKSNWLALLILMTSYNIVSISFCYTISSFCSQRTVAVIIGGVVWLVTYFPYVKIINRMSDYYMDPFRYLFFNTAMGLALDNIVHLEQHNNGYGWAFTFHIDNDYDQPLSIGAYIFIMLGQSIILILLGLYVEEINPGVFGRPRKWYYIFKFPTKSSSRNSLRAHRVTKVFEVETDDKNILMKLDQISWVYKDKTIVNDFSENLGEGDITGIMGHNGSGKTVLLLIIAGLIQPTRGTIYINNLNVAKHRYLLAKVGVAIKDMILYDELTMFDQLTFFCKAKGLDDDSTETEVLTYINYFKLINFKDVRTRNLTYSVRHILALCCALIGNSEIILLDDVTSALDVCQRKLLWSLLLKEKNTRTILFTSHSSDEVELLSDRIAILSEGNLQCCGKLSFLKSVYLQGAQLICVKGKHCRTVEVTRVIENYIPDISPLCDLGTHLTYLLEQKYSDFYVTIMTELEKKFEELDLEYCTITEPSVAEIFFDMGVESPSQGDEQRYKNILNGKSPHWEQEDLSFLDSYQSQKEFFLILNNIYANILKHFLNGIRSKLSILTVCLIPFIFITTTYIMLVENPDIPNRMTFSLSQYKDDLIILNSPESTPFVETIKENYIQSVFWAEGNHDIMQVHDVAETMISQKNSVHDQEFLVGATLGSKNIIAWFNSYPLHSAPLSLNLIHTAIAHSIYDTNVGIEVTLAPLPHTMDSDSLALLGFISWTYFQSINIALCGCFIWSLRVIFLVRERNSSFKQTQLICGYRFWCFWGVLLIYDLLTVILPSSLIILAFLYFYNLENFVLQPVIGYIFILLIFGGLCICIWNYIISYFFQNPAIAYSAVVCINLFGLACFFAFSEVYHRNYRGGSKTFNLLEYIFYILPYFSLSSGICKLFLINGVTQICTYEHVKLISVSLRKCKTNPNCCLQHNMWTSTVGIMPEVIALVLIAIISWICLWKADHNIKCRCKRRNHRKSLRSMERTYSLHHIDSRRSTIHTSVIYEKAKINTLRPNNLNEIPLICNNLTKYKSRNEAHKAALFLVIDRSECFGILGQNMSGKSSILKMLSGLKNYEFGTLTIDGIDVQDNIPEIYDRIGYTQQNATFLPDYTGYELLQICAYLCGVPHKNVKKTSECLIKALGFYSFCHVPIGLYSSGNLKRLSIAVGLLGNSSIIFLDDPTTYLDEGGQRQLWNVLLHLKESEKAVLFTTVNSNECEKVCNRIAIVEQEQFNRIGVPSLIINENFKGNILRIKLRSLQYAPHSFHPTQRNSLIAIRNTYRLRQFMEDEFPEAELKDDWNTIITYKIPNKPSSYIFEKIQHNTFILNIEYFSIRRVTYPFICNEDAPQLHEDI